MIITATIAVALVANGLAAGVLMGTVLGGVPLLTSLPPQQYVATHAFFATRYDPFMPVCLLVTVVADIGLAVMSTTLPASVAIGAGAGLALMTMTISVTKNVPINTWVRSLDPLHLPDDFGARDPRRQWRRWNGVRTATATTGFVVTCIGAAVLIS